mmetsp:Transcript_24238/g.41060  ORF Transcript_24238/g.41060 Transcript_24238/m.41060 type:complete len:233 (+) Transcript_24238:64-762(+)
MLSEEEACRFSPRLLSTSSNNAPCSSNKCCNSRDCSQQRQRFRFSQVQCRQVWAVKATALATLFLSQATWPLVCPRRRPFPLMVRTCSLDHPTPTGCCCSTRCSYYGKSSSSGSSSSSRFSTIKPSNLFRLQPIPVEATTASVLTRAGSIKDPPFWGPRVLEKAPQTTACRLTWEVLGAFQPPRRRWRVRDTRPLAYHPPRPVLLLLLLLWRVQRTIAWRNGSTRHTPSLRC